MFEAVDVQSMDNQGFIFQTCLSRAKLNKQESRGQGNITSVVMNPGHDSCRLHAQ